MGLALVLHGARKNAGDFLIRERGLALLARLRPDLTLVDVPRWTPLAAVQPLLDRATLVVLCGGPGYAADFHPGVFPLAPDLADLRVPVVPLGLGLGVGIAPAALDRFAFTPASVAALRAIAGRGVPLTARDALTARVLAGLGVGDPVMTGCPAWYHLPDLERPWPPPARIRRLVVTAPQASGLARQAISLLRLVGARFRTSERHLVFHRGIGPDRYTSTRAAAANALVAAAGLALGYRIHDAAFGTERIRFYGACDLHVGYRVHAHVDFLSRRRPSLLLWEDVRGAGQSVTLGTDDVDAHHPDALALVAARLEAGEAGGFARGEQAVEVMRRGFATMAGVLRSL